MTDDLTDAEKKNAVASEEPDSIQAGSETSDMTAGDSEPSETAYPHLIRGIICAIAGGSLWGFSGACVQYLLQNYAISPLQISSVRMPCAGFLFIIYLLIRQRGTLKRIVHDRRSILQLSIFGIAGLFLSQVTYIIVIGYTNAGTATVLQCTSIIFVMVATCLIVRRLPHKAEMIGLILACGATWLIATKGDPTQIVMPLPGLIWGLANGITVAFYIMYPRRLLKDYGSLAVTGCGMLLGGAAALIITLPQGSYPQIDGAGIAVFAIVVVLGTCASYCLYLQGVADAGAMRASMLGVAEPVAATLISWLWLGTSFTVADIAGFVLMIAMVLIVSRSR